jgi:hypothetical protein
MEKIDETESKREKKYQRVFCFVSIVQDMIEISMEF